MQKFKALENCRMCHGSHFDAVVELGDQYLTGVFPRSIDETLTRGPLTLGLCADCGLLQLMHSYQPSELYGVNYGYRSSLNRSMVDHLACVASTLCQAVQLMAGDVVLDIGSNDGTLLSFYPKDLTLVGYDPSIVKFADYYRSDSIAIPEFFTSDSWEKQVRQKESKSNNLDSDAL